MQENSKFTFLSYCCNILISLGRPSYCRPSRPIGARNDEAVVNGHCFCLCWKNPLLYTTRSYFLQNVRRLDNGFDDIFSEACIDTPCDSRTSTLDTYYSNFIAWKLYAQKSLMYRKSQYWLFVAHAKWVSWSSSVSPVVRVNQCLKGVLFLYNFFIHLVKLCNKTRRKQQQSKYWRFIVEQNRLVWPKLGLHWLYDLR